MGDHFGYIGEIISWYAKFDSTNYKVRIYA